MIVAALKQEVEGLPNQILLTGVGKINATKVLRPLTSKSDLVAKSPSQKSF